MWPDCFLWFIYLFSSSSTSSRLNPSFAAHDMPVMANSVYPDQLASEEANWSGSALFVIKYVNFYKKKKKKPGSSNLIGCK